MNRHRAVSGVPGTHRQTGWHAGSTGTKGVRYYRFGTIQDRTRLSSQSVSIDDLVITTGMQSQRTDRWNRVIESHTIKVYHLEDMEEQVHWMVNRLVVPADWYETIMAYYLSNKGMADFERESYNLHQELARLQDMYTNGYLTQAQFQERTMTLTQDLQTLQPSAKPEARAIEPLLREFPAIWAQMSSGERRVLLKTMFVALYFDRNVKLKQILTNAPFDQLLNR